jgi:hypothetical protein
MPLTTSSGSNVLVRQDAQKLRFDLANILNDKEKKGTAPPLWDGYAGERIADVLIWQQLSRKLFAF